MNDIQKGWRFVWGQFIILFLALVSSILEPRLFDYNLSITRISIGGFFAGIGIFCMIWSVVSFKQTITAHPIPKDEYKLMKEGIYKYVRHPIYFSAIVMTIGGVLLFNSYLSLFWVIVLFIWFDRKASFEESFLSKKFPDYNSYRSITKKLIPLIY